MSATWLNRQVPRYSAVKSSVDNDRQFDLDLPGSSSKPVKTGKSVCGMSRADAHTNATSWLGVCLLCVMFSVCVCVCVYVFVCFCVFL